MAKKQTIDQGNFNAWRKTVNPDAVDYVSQGPEKDNAAIQWANNNGYDNSKVYTAPAATPTVPTTPAAAPAVTTPTVADVAKKSADTGKSFVQMYHDSIAPPVYDQPRANALKTNANLSVVSDIAKLIGEGITTSKGGTPIKRESQAPQLNAHLQQLNDVYKRDSQSYKANGLQYMLADEKDKRAREALAVENARKAAVAAQAQSNSDRTFNQSKTNSDRTYDLSKTNSTRADKTLANTVRHDKVMENKPTASSIEKTQDVVGADNRLTTISKKEVSAWSAEVAKKAMADPTISIQDKAAFRAYPDNAFKLHWDKYLTIQDGHLVPKQATTPTAQRPAPIKSTYLPGLPKQKTIPNF